MKMIETLAGGRMARLLFWGRILAFAGVVFYGTYVISRIFHYWHPGSPANLPENMTSLTSPWHPMLVFLLMPAAFILGALPLLRDASDTRWLRILAETLYLILVFYSLWKLTEFLFFVSGSGHSGPAL